ncbi:MAG: cyclic nucleotide-binding domain-containing protein [Deltaproteobacteria bacterium]|nr:cyclic nucleotide-binding domain-containing protein [Deltaproteobacteria bacterium]
MDPFSTSPLVKSFWFGILSAAALPLGALLGIFLRPGKYAVAAIMSYGAGTLFAVLAYELVHPSAQHGGFPAVTAGVVLGGVTFVFLNNLLNGQGAFLRKPATIIRYLIVFKRKRIRTMVLQLSHIKVLRALNPDEIRGLIPLIRLRHFEAGSVVFNQGDIGDSLYLIDDGEVEVLRDGRPIDRMGAGDSFGEVALLTGEPRNATLRCISTVRAWQIMKDDFDWIVKKTPLLYDSLKKLSVERTPAADKGSKAWSESVVKDIGALSMGVSDRDVQEATRVQGGGAAFAIWLGMLLDGIPEGAVVGASMVNTTVSIALMVGIFIANFPEAISSAVGLRSQQVKIRTIMWMWGSITLVGGLCSLLGYTLLLNASPVAFAIFEGFGAGVMLVVIAETMLPEAYQMGGSIVGISTLLGFLSGLLLNLMSK